MILTFKCGMEFCCPPNMRLVWDQNAWTVTRQPGGTILTTYGRIRSENVIRRKMRHDGYVLDEDLTMLQVQEGL